MKTGKRLKKKNNSVYWNSYRHPFSCADDYSLRLFKDTVLQSYSRRRE